jgi:hypothetical protein
MLKLLAFVLPLGLDSFCGRRRDRREPDHHRLAAASHLADLVIFEGGMPLIGLALGSMLARGVGRVAGYLAAAAVIGIGCWMLLAVPEPSQPRPAAS